MEWRQQVAASPEIKLILIKSLPAKWGGHHHPQVQLSEAIKPLIEKNASKIRTQFTLIKQSVTPIKISFCLVLDRIEF